MPTDLMKFSQVALSIRCTKLRDTDRLSKSDPMAVVSIKKNGVWTKVGSTEVISNNLNPAFVKKPVVPYNFNQIQELKIEILDYDGPGKFQLIGEVESVRLGELLSAVHGWEAELSHAKHTKNGKIWIQTEEVGSNSDLVTMIITTTDKLPKADLLSSDPYLVFYRQIEGSAGLVKIHKTEVVHNNRSPTFKEFTISSAILCGGEYKTPIIVKCFDSDGKQESGDDYMCEATFSLEQLASSHTSLELPMHVYKECAKDRPDSATMRPAGATGKDGGKLKFSFKIEHSHSFLDYIQGGTELSMDIAIDCTGSNGEIKSPSSLHHLGYGTENQYAKNIRKIGEVIAQYDSDQRYAVYGFGAKVPMLGHGVHHAFPMNMNLDDPTVAGVKGIIDAYTSGIQKITLNGPTILGDILNLTENKVRQFSNPHNYHILLIFTDGQVNDLEECIAKVIELSMLPVSVIIIGLGNGPFDGMEVLDCDGTDARGRRKMLTMGGVSASRDIVQFVEARKFPSIDDLCSKVLEEIPSQVEQYMQLHNLEPIPPPAM